MLCRQHEFSCTLASTSVLFDPLLLDMLRAAAIG